MVAAKKGDKVKVEYVGKLEDGTVIDSSEQHEAPLEFTVGAGELIQGFDDGVIGMEVGQEKEVEIDPNSGYGAHNPELVKELPKDCFQSDQEIKPGMMFLLNLPDGRQLPAKISEVTEEAVTVDLNPPLAGKKLIFWIKLIEIAE